MISAVSKRKPIALSVTAAMAAICMASTEVQAGQGSGHDFEINTLSGRPDTVSGGDAVIEVRVPRYMRASDVAVRLNGRDITGQFAANAAGNRLTGLVTGLREGKNRVTVSARHHHRNQHFEKLEITNHPIHGEIFGPHQQPWVCETEASGLGPPPVSGPCVVPTRYDWFYRSTSGDAAAAAEHDAARCPADLAQTTTIDGKTVNYIVRVESGTINESIYRIAILDDPANPISNPVVAGGKKPGAGWNGKLTYPFGGGCGPGFRSGRQRRRSPSTSRHGLHGRAAEPRLRGRVRHAQHARHRLRRRGLGRDRDDDQGALHRAVRRAEVHDRPRRLGRRDAAAPDRAQLPGPARRASRRASRTRTSRRRRHGRHRLRAAEQLLRHRRQSGGLARQRGAPRSTATRSDPSGPHRTADGWNGLRDATGRTRPTASMPVVPLGARYDPVTNPRRRARHVLGRHRQRLRQRPGDRLRAPALRQRRRPVRPARAQQRGHHEGRSSST